MKYDPSTHEPIMFETSSHIRFGDVDRYDHVNSLHYIDYVYTSRFDYIEERHGISAGEFLRRGVGFYAVHT